MAAKAIQLELLKQILRLKQDGFSVSAIARTLGLSRPTVIKYLSRLKANAEEPAQLKDTELSQAAYNHDPIPHKGERYNRLVEHFSYAEKELTKTGVTRQLLWVEYKEQCPDGYNYSQYCYHFQEYLKNKEVVMHLEHRAGEKIRMDFAGKKLSYVDPESGEVIRCEVFVAVLPHSGLTFCYTVHSQTTGDFLHSINQMLLYFGGAPLTILCDNLKTAVTRSCRYEPVFTEVCYQLSEHYATTFSATRPYHPRDKAMVERAVNICYTHIYAPLRKEVFTSLKQLNGAIRKQLDLLNLRPYKGSSYSRRDLFFGGEQALLKPLPAEAFTPKNVVQLTVQRNYHIQLTEDHHYYSAPYRFAGKKVRVLYDSRTLEIYLGQDRIAFHFRSGTGSCYHTIQEHMPSSHRNAQDIKGFTKGDLLAQALEIGPSTHSALERILISSPYPEQNFKSAHGVLMLVRAYSKQRVEAACARVLRGTRINYTLLKNILRTGLDKKPLEPEQEVQLPLHENIRGPEHYQ
jgi:transposase